MGVGAACAFVANPASTSATDTAIRKGCALSIIIPLLLLADRTGLGPRESGCQGSLRQRSAAAGRGRRQIRAVLSPGPPALSSRSAWQSAAGASYNSATQGRWPGATAGSTNTTRGST